jgi:hypothetical protein
LLRVEKEIPFERKLRPMMRPFRERFQSIIRLRNALNCGIVGLRARLGRVKENSLSGVRLDSRDIRNARELTAVRVPAWIGEEMRIYDGM